MSRLPRTGSIQTSATGCTTASFAVSGLPQIGGYLDFSWSGTTGLGTLAWLGTAALDLPLCSGCKLGTEFGVTLPTALSLHAEIPLDPTLVGAQFRLQGAEVFTASGCVAGSGARFRTTDTTSVRIGP